MTMINSTPEWQALVQQAESIKATHLRELFATDEMRAERMTLQSVDILLDLSKNLLRTETIDNLLDLARAVDVEGKRDAMFAGAVINKTEERPVLHTALRTQSDAPIWAEGRNVVPDIRRVQERLYHAAEQIRTQQWLGYSGRPIKNVVNIGIGGSDLGPAMAVEALRFYATRDIVVRFISNVDATDFVETVHDLDPSETLFIVASKTFTTDETLTNATTARQWIIEALGDEDAVASHFVALSTNLAATNEFGIAPANVFEFWDWVGGRYSLTSAIGFSVMVAIGVDNFKELLRGFAAMDEHFRTAPLERNGPAMLALVGIWNNNFLGYATQAILPYEQYLHRLPAYLQQADMESNGKSVTIDGSLVTYATSSVVWGEAGTNGQHAFYQLLHQGTQIVPVDFIGFIESLHVRNDHHDKLMANMFAQSRALAFGRTADEVRSDGVHKGLAPHKTFGGNRPSNTILLPKLTPYTLGQLIALYEHKIFVQGVIWNVNSFDQWGVELGKALAGSIFDDIRSGQLQHRDSSTDALLAAYLRGRS